MMKILFFILIPFLLFAQSDPLLILMDDSAVDTSGNYLTSAYITRVEGDGGTVIDSLLVNEFINDAVTKGYYDSLKVVLDANFGVKKDAKNKVVALYDLIGVNDFTQTDTSIAPTWVDNLYGAYAGIVVDGTNDYTERVCTAQIVAQPYTIIMNLKNNKDNASLQYFDESASARALVGMNATNKIHIYAGALLADTSVISIGTDYLIGATFNNTNSKIYVNGTLKTTGAGGTNALGANTESLILGATQAFAPSGITFSTFIIKQGTLLNDINTFFNSKYLIY